MYNLIFLKLNYASPKSTLQLCLPSVFLCPLILPEITHVGEGQKVGVSSLTIFGDVTKESPKPHVYLLFFHCLIGCTLTYGYCNYCLQLWGPTKHLTIQAAAWQDFWFCWHQVCHCVHSFLARDLVRDWLSSWPKSQKPAKLQDPLHSILYVSLFVFLAPLYSLWLILVN